MFEISENKIWNITRSQAPSPYKRDLRTQEGAIYQPETRPWQTQNLPMPSSWPSQSPEL
jgi:hypothetical protein